MPVILALDTSTPRVSVAILHDGGVAGVRIDAGRRTGALLAPTVADLLAAHDISPDDLTGVAVGVGPGPYTSLRVGIMFAATVGYASHVQVVGACSHDVIARKAMNSLPVGGVTSDATFSVATDARRREVYLSRYDRAGTRITGPVVLPADDARLRWPDDHWVSDATPDARALATWAATEWPTTTAELQAVPARWQSAASDGAESGWVPQALLVPQPLYLRRPDATEPVRT